jgi:hypothetical protein
MHVFEDQEAENFCRRVMQYIIREFPLAVNGISGEKIFDRVRNAFTRAQIYGFGKESTYLAYIALSFTVAPEFDDHPAIRRILTDSAVPPDSRMALLAQEITSEQWADARCGAAPGISEHHVSTAQASAK